jgi:hypothetical protein
VGRSYQTTTATYFEAQNRLQIEAHFGLQNLVFFLVNFNASEAQAYLRWLAWAIASCLAGRTPLLINLDETSVALTQEGGAGAVVTAKTPGGCGRKGGSRAVLADRRAAITHVALATEDHNVQPYLPQVLLGNKRLLTKKVMAAVTKAGPVTVVAAKSSWNTSAKMVTILGVLADVLAEKAPGRQAVLLLDGAKLHLTNEVLKKAWACDIMLVPIPAATTAFLQPLDSRVFSGYKAFLRRGYEELRLSCAGGNVC